MIQIPEKTIKEIYNFGHTIRDFADGKIEFAAFKAYLAVTGIYEERTLNTYMLRPRIPSGVISIEQFSEISNIAKEYSFGKIHFTTRQDLQFHGTKFEDLEKIMDRLLKIGLTSKGTGGSSPRNVVVDPLSGTAADSLFDVTHFGIAAAEDFLKNDDNYKLPRKYKIAFSSSEADRGLAKISDLGFVAVIKDGVKGFRVYAGGGLGGAARPGIIIKEFIEAEQSVLYIEAMRQFFFEQGDRTNRAKARVRHILIRLGEERFTEEFKRYLAKVSEERKIDTDNYKKYCISLIQEDGEAITADNINILEGYVKGRYNIYVHPVNGHISSENIDKIIDAIKALNYKPSIRLTSTQGFYIREIDGKDVGMIKNSIKDVSSGYITDRVVACTGASTCKLGICLSQGLSGAIIEFFGDKGVEVKNALPVVNISGCPNSCGQHQSGKIGFTGRARKIGEYFVPVYTLLLGGDLRGETAKFGKEFGEIPAKSIPAFLYELAEYKMSQGYDVGDEEFYRFITEKENEIMGLVKDFGVIPDIGENEDYYKDFGRDEFFMKK